jgi:hypothetical protein
MIIKSKRNGAGSTAGETAKKGFKGTIQFWAEARESGFYLCFKDTGNYGKTRWEAEVPLNSGDLESVISKLSGLEDGSLTTTQASADEVAALVAAVEAAATPAPEAPAATEPAPAVEAAATPVETASQA